MKRYALRVVKTQELLGFYTNIIGNADYYSTSYSLDETTDNLWLVKQPEHAEWVRFNRNGYLDNCYDGPSHNYKPEELEVVEINLHPTVSKVAKVAIPSVLEFYEQKYAEKEPTHWAYLKGLIEKGQIACYSWLELKTLLQEKQKSS